MTGSLEHVGGDRWRVRLYVGRRDGRDVLRTRSFRASGERAAKRKASGVIEALRADLDAEAAEEARPGTVADLMSRFLAHREQLGASPTTMRAYRGMGSRIVAALGDIELRELTAQHCDDYYASLRAETSADGKPARGEHTIHHYHRLLAATLRQAERWGMVDRVATRNATPPGWGTHRIAVPSDAMILALFAGCRPELRFAVALAAMTGLRRGELIGLRWSDVDGDVLHVRRSIIEVGPELVVKGTKTGRERDIVLGPEAMAGLVAHREHLEGQARQLGAELAGDGPLLPNLAADPAGSVPRRPGWLSLAWARRCEAHGVKVRLHDLRHWHATTLIDRGIPVTTVAERLGHAQTSTTLNVYARATRESDVRAAAAIEAALRPRLPAPDPPG